MSPSWRDQIHIYFAPKRVDMVQSSRGFKPVQQPKVTTTCDQTEPGQQVWESALQQLDTMLQDVAGSELTVVLSNHFVRYVTLPPQAEITTPEELNAYAMFRMREIYDKRVDNWTLSVSAWDPIDGAICAAIPTELLTQFEQLATAKKIKLTAVEPYLASVCDHWQKTLTASQLCLVLVEAERICIALLDQGRWQSIRNQRVFKDLDNELQVALDQELILSNTVQVPEVAYLFAPEYPALTLSIDNSWQLKVLPTDEISVLPHYPSADSAMNTNPQPGTAECVA